MAFGQKSYGEQVGEFEGGRSLDLQPDAINAGYRLLRPTLQHETVVRVLPEVRVEDGRTVIVPHRHKPGNGMFTDWVAPFKVCQISFSSYVSFICQVPNQDFTAISALTDDNTPADVFCKRLQQLSESDGCFPDGTPYSRLSTLFKYVKGKGAPVKRPALHVYLQCLRLKAGGKFTWKNTPDPKENASNMRQVLRLSSSARESLQALCNKERHDWKQAGIPPESLDRYECGDWLGHQVNPQGNISGRALQIATRAVLASLDNAQSQGGDGRIAFFGDSSASAVAEGAIAGMSGGRSGDDPTQNNYECHLAFEQELPAAWVHALWRPWEKLIQLFHPDQQVEKILSAGFPPMIVLKAFEQHPDWLPSSIKSGLMVSAPVPVAAGYPSVGMTPMPSAMPAPGFAAPTMPAMPGTAAGLVGGVSSIGTPMPTMPGVPQGMGAPAMPAMPAMGAPAGFAMMGGPVPPAPPVDDSTPTAGSFPMPAVPQQPATQGQMMAAPATMPGPQVVGVQPTAPGINPTGDPRSASASADALARLRANTVTAPVQQG